MIASSVFKHNTVQHPGTFIRFGPKYPPEKQYPLSQELKINPNTVQKAMTHLIQGKIIEVRPGIGCTVASVSPATPEQRTEILEKKIEELVVEAKRLGLNERDITKSVHKSWS